MRQIIPWIGICVLVLFGYSNCSNYSDNNLFNGSFMCPEGNCSMQNGQIQSLKIASTNMVMGCEEEQLQIGGYCNPGDVANSYITYGLTRNGAPINWSNGQSSMQLSPSCEGGRFNLVLRRPNDSTCSNCTLDYQLNMQIFTVAAEGQTPVAGTKYTDTVQIQWGGCTTPAAIPVISAEPPAWPYAMTPAAKCFGVGPTAASIACSGGASVSWTQGFPPTSIAANCPAGRTKFGGCFSSGTCSAASGGAIPTCTAVAVQCNLECF